MKIKNTRKVIALMLAGIIAIMMFSFTPSVYAEGETIELNGVQYATFGEAFDTIQEAGDYTIKLLADSVDESTANSFVYDNITIDLNGHKFTTARKYCVLGGNLRITGNGTLETSNSAPFVLYGNETYKTSVTVDNGVTLSSTYSGNTSGWFFIIGTKGYENYITVNFNGKMTKTGNADMNGFTVTGVCDDNNSVFNIGSTAVIENVNYGIYGAGPATWNVSGTINANKAGIEMRAGELNVTGGKISSSYATTEVVPNGNGPTTLGAALAVAQHTTKKPIKVNVTGGTFTANTAFNEANPQGNDEESINKIDISISEGTFISGEGNNAVESEDFDGFITGGTFSTYVDEKCANGYCEYPNMDYTRFVVDRASTVKVNGTSKIKDGEDYVDAYILNVGETKEFDFETTVAGLEKYTLYGLVANGSVATMDGTTITAEKPGFDMLIYSHGRSGGAIIVVVLDVQPEDKTEDAEVTAASAATDLIGEFLLDVDAEIPGLDEETKEAILNAIVDGQTIVAEVVMDELEPTTEEVKMIEKELDGAKVAGYFDISVILKVDGEEIGKITDLGKKVTIDVPVPEGLPEVKAGLVRTFKIVRIHDGKVEVVAEGLKAVDGKIPVETDKFSTYAVAYEDVSAKNPKTGDAITIVAATLVVAMAGLVITKKMKK